MEFVPFGQNSIPPPAGKTTKYRIIKSFYGGIKKRRIEG
jgi:hypothetical protein